MYNNKEDFKTDYLREFNRILGKSVENCSMEEKYRVLVNLLRDKLSVNWVDSERRYRENGEKEVYYFSL